MGKYLYWLSLFIFVTPLTGQNFNRPVPPIFYPYEFISHTVIPGYYLTVPSKQSLTLESPSFCSIPITIIDSNGYVVWYFDNQMVNADFKYYSEHQLFSFTNAVNKNLTMYYILDVNLSIVDSITNTPNLKPEGHDFQILLNGNYLVSAEKDTIMNLSNYVLDSIVGGVNTSVESYVIQEFDSNKKLVFEWSSMDHIAPTEGYSDNYGYNEKAFDYAHGNAIEEDLDGNFLVSMRNLNAIYKIDHHTGNVIWKLGGRSSDFTFINDLGFSGQHDIRRLPSGKISLFDNGNCAELPKRSRGIEYELDTIKWTATRTWQYVHRPSFYARAMGNHQVVNNDYHLINYGNCYRPNPSIVLIDSLGNLFTEINFTDSVFSYRSFYYDSIPFNFKRPQINCINDGPNIVLSAPAGYSKYIWSTGETSQSIRINTIDTFQVWVNYGIGMLGSEPFIISEMKNLGIDLVKQEEPEFILYYNLLGIETKTPVTGNMYFATTNDNGKRFLIIRK